MDIVQYDESQSETYGFSLTEIINLGKLVNIAYALFEDPPNKKIKDNPDFPEQFVEDYQAIINLRAGDCVDKPEREFYGHLSWHQKGSGHLVISIRGTSDAAEWEQDIKFFKTHYPFDKSIGQVELGFSEIFSTFIVSEPTNEKQTDLFEYLASLENVEQVTVVGHSLGSSLATLVSTEIARRELVSNVRLLTFASPLVGDANFVKYAENKINHYLRIVNSPDLVPKTPPKILGFRHMGHKYQINSLSNKKIKHSVVCFHSLSTYLHLLDAMQPIQRNCQHD